MNQPAHPSDLSLLRRFEPQVRFTRGERFFPMDVERYINQCSLWVKQPNQPPKQLVPQGELNMNTLVEPRQHGFGAVYYLKFIDPLDLLELARYSLNKAVRVLTGTEADVFRAGRGRLARVGYVSRFLDALFSVTLFLRGRVPGDTAAAAALAYRRMQSEDERYTYYGRMVRENGWVVLQYWFFYPFNNWRSGFFGVNDHEGDWEMVSVYCSEEVRDGSYRIMPEWVAYASHDYFGDDLRRRWDDPEVHKVGEHPVIYAGAGSHASYYAPGEYLAELELHFLSPIMRLAEAVHNIWVSVLRQAGSPTQKPNFHVFRVPFVDYARGDGMSIGPQADKPWVQVSLNSPARWVVGYRGLWGLYARDPISGENAPAGPMYNRDGSVRQSWYNPLGWAGLDKVPPPDETLVIMQARRAQTNQLCTELRYEIEQKSNRLLGLGAERAAILDKPHMEELYQAHSEEIQKLSTELDDVRRRLTIEEAKLEALQLYEKEIASGQRGPLRAHIYRAHQPSSEVDLRLNRLAEGYAAVSIGLLMIGIMLLVIFARDYLLFGLAAMIGALIFIESGFRRQLTRLLTSLSIGLAIVSAFVLLFEFFWQMVVMSVLAVGLYIMWENFREIRG